MQNVMILGLLVIVRTFLSWSLVVEIEGRWPWKGGRGDPLTVPTDEGYGEMTRIK